MKVTADNIKEVAARLEGLAGQGALVDALFSLGLEGDAEALMAQAVSRAATTLHVLKEQAPPGVPERLIQHAGVTTGWIDGFAHALALTAIAAEVTSD